MLGLSIVLKRSCELSRFRFSKCKLPNLEQVQLWLGPKIAVKATAGLRFS